MAAKTMMELMLPVFQVTVPVPPYPAAWSELADPWDLPIWGAAVASGAQYVVSENTRDFPPANADGRHVWNDIEYVTRREFLARLPTALTDEE